MTAREIAMTHLKESGSSIEVQVQVLDLSEIGELVVNILLGGLLVNAGHEQNVPLDGWCGEKR